MKYIFYLSASSKISTSILSNENVGVFFKWSINLPGVAITISGLLLNTASLKIIINILTAIYFCYLYLSSSISIFV